MVREAETLLSRLRGFPPPPCGHDPDEDLEVLLGAWKALGIAGGVNPLARRAEQFVSRVGSITPHNLESAMRSHLDRLERSVSALIDAGAQADQTPIVRTGSFGRGVDVVSLPNPKGTRELTYVLGAWRALWHKHELRQLLAEDECLELNGFGWLVLGEPNWGFPDGLVPKAWYFRAEVLELTRFHRGQQLERRAEEKQRRAEEARRQREAYLAAPAGKLASAQRRIARLEEALADQMAAQADAAPPRPQQGFVTPQPAAPSAGGQS